jgi:hypothetical protein
MLRIFCGRIVDARWKSDKMVECVHNLLNCGYTFLFEKAARRGRVEVCKQMILLS